MISKSYRPDVSVSALRTDCQSTTGKHFYVQVKMEDLDEIVNSHLIGGKAVERLRILILVQSETKTLSRYGF